MSSLTTQAYLLRSPTLEHTMSFHTDVACHRHLIGLMRYPQGIAPQQFTPGHPLPLGFVNGTHVVMAH